MTLAAGRAAMLGAAAAAAVAQDAPPVATPPVEVAEETPAVDVATDPEVKASGEAPAEDPAAASAVGDEARGRLQERYLAYLREAGYQPEVDAEGDVQFTREELNYYVVIDADDPDYFRLLLPGIWRIESDAERSKVLTACDHTTRVTKVAKAYTSGDFANISVEMMLPGVDVAAIFPRSLEILDAALATFDEAMGR